MRRIELNGSKVDVLPVVKGLVSEGEKVRQIIESSKPDVVGVSISKEELEGLAKKEDYELYEMSFLEQVYKAHLEEFGEVKLPPPCYVEAYDLCSSQDIKLMPLDMNEELYSDTYCIKVGGLDLLRESYFSSRAHKLKLDHSSPETFVKAWDRRVNRAKGFRELNEEREKHMADCLRRLVGKNTTILALVECERADGVCAWLEKPLTAP
jgi:pheromone shutdown protein TraB